MIVLVIFAFFLRSIEEATKSTAQQFHNMSIEKCIFTNHHSIPIPFHFRIASCIYDKKKKTCKKKCCLHICIFRFLKKPLFNIYDTAAKFKSSNYNICLLLHSELKYTSNIFITFLIKT